MDDHLLSIRRVSLSEATDPDASALAESDLEHMPHLVVLGSLDEELSKGFLTGAAASMAADARVASVS